MLTPEVTKPELALLWLSWFIALVVAVVGAAVENASLVWVGSGTLLLVMLTLVLSHEAQEESK